MSKYVVFSDPYFPVFGHLELLEDLLLQNKPIQNQQKISETPPMMFSVVKNLLKVTNKNIRLNYWMLC